MAIKSYFKSHMIKRILHSWSFYMKFIKLAKGSFKKISYEMTTRVRSSIYYRFMTMSSRATNGPGFRYRTTLASTTIITTALSSTRNLRSSFWRDSDYLFRIS